MLASRTENGSSRQPCYRWLKSFPSLLISVLSTQLFLRGFWGGSANTVLLQHAHVLQFCRISRVIIATADTTTVMWHYFRRNLPVLGPFSTVSCRTISLVLQFAITKQRSGQRMRLRTKFNRSRYQPSPPYCFALP